VKLPTIEEVAFFSRELRAEDETVKGAVLLSPHIDVPREDFFVWFDTTWVPAVRELLPNRIREIHCRRVEVPGGVVPPFEAVTELWWEDRSFLAKDEDGLTQLAELLTQDPVDATRTSSLLGYELRAIWPDDPATSD
jgi:hypothetical protein